MSPISAALALAALLAAPAGALGAPLDDPDRPPAEPAPLADPEPPRAPAPAPDRDPDRPPPEPAPVPPQPRPGWIEETHTLVEQELGGMTGWVDAFFGDERDADPQRAGSLLRWRNELRLDDRRRVGARTRFLASIELPALERRLSRASLVLTGESAADPSGGLADDSSAAVLTPTLKVEQASLDLRLQLLARGGTTIDAGPGIGLRWPLEGHLGTRLRQRFGPALGIEGRFTQAVFYSSRDRFGGSSDLDLSRPLAAHLLLRSRSHALLSEVSRGLEWGSELGLAYDLQPLRLGLYAAGALSGASRPVNEVAVYRAFLRVRRDVWRRWLFLEVEPEVLWPTAPPLGRHKEHAVTLRLEVAFDAKAPAPLQPVTP